MYLGRVVLCGDSGHAVLPTAGTGATLAMESAAVLAEELCRSTPAYRDIQHALLMWQMRRAPRIQRVRQEGNLLATAITWSNPLAVFYRNFMTSNLPGNYFSDSMMKLLYDPI
jgi:2-polyprenyl-6-methoxyphenol hydroxylase-like FAD-dependent oxidoreductase